MCERVILAGTIYVALGNLWNGKWALCSVRIPPYIIFLSFSYLLALVNYVFDESNVICLEMMCFRTLVYQK